MLCDIKYNEQKLFPSVLLSISWRTLSLYSSFSLTPQTFPKAEGRGSRIHRGKAIYALGLFPKLDKDFKGQHY